MVRFGYIVRKARIKKQLTQQQLADLVNCGVAHITRIENESVYPSVKLLEQLFNALDVTAYRGVPIFNEHDKAKVFDDIVNEIQKLDFDDLDMLLNIAQIMSVRKKK